MVRIPNKKENAKPNILEISKENPLAFNNTFPPSTMGKLIKNPTYIATAFAAKIAAPYYAKYTEGMNYGNHVDDPVMGPANQRYRSDISITILLNAPEK